MKHEHDFHNGHRFDPYDEPSNEELGIERYPGWALWLVWLGLGFASVYLFWLPLYRLFRAWWVGA